MLRPMLDVAMLRGPGNGERPTDPSVDSIGDQLTDPNAERVLRCRPCAEAITRPRDAIEVDGKHTHVFINPAGIPFDIACFAQAPGALVHGEPETDWSWFAGYAWRYANCGACGAHLGWHYVGESPFFGLIRARLRESD